LSVIFRRLHSCQEPQLQVLPGSWPRVEKTTYYPTYAQNCSILCIMGVRTVMYLSAPTKCISVCSVSWRSFWLIGSLSANQVLPVKIEPKKC
jgi:hypothetical protein